jgi:hypothetical protein
LFMDPSGFSLISILSSIPEILSSTYSNLLKLLSTIPFIYLKEHFIFSISIWFFFWSLSYLFKLLFHILFCLFISFIPFFLIPLVSFWSLLKSSLSSYSYSLSSQVFYLCCLDSLWVVFICSPWISLQASSWVFWWVHFKFLLSTCVYRPHWTH